MSNSVKIHEIVKQNLKDAVLIDGFPSVGLVGTIVANFLINTLKLEQIGIIFFNGTIFLCQRSQNWINEIACSDRRYASLSTLERIPMSDTFSDLVS